MLPLLFFLVAVGAYVPDDPCCCTPFCDPHSHLRCSSHANRLVSGDNFLGPSQCGGLGLFSRAAGVMLDACWKTQQGMRVWV
jgi:hypothetical protein